MEGVGGSSVVFLGFKTGPSPIQKKQSLDSVGLIFCGTSCHVFFGLIMPESEQNNE